MCTNCRWSCFCNSFAFQYCWWWNVVSLHPRTCGVVILCCLFVQILSHVCVGYIRFVILHFGFGYFEVNISSQKMSSETNCSVQSTLEHFSQCFLFRGLSRRAQIWSELRFKQLMVFKSTKLFCLNWFSFEAAKVLRFYKLHILSRRSHCRKYYSCFSESVMSVTKHE